MSVLSITGKKAVQVVWLIIKTTHCHRCCCYLRIYYSISHRLFCQLVNL